MDNAVKEILAIIVTTVACIVVAVVVLQGQHNRMTLKMTAQGYVYVPATSGHWEKK